MKRMHLWIIAIGLGIGALLVARLAVRSEPLVRQATGRMVAPMDRLQDGIRLDRKTDYSADPTASQRQLEKLRQEELRQKPEERRN